MNEIIKIEDGVNGNDILVWNEIEQAFIPVAPSYEQLNLERLEITHQPLSPNHQVIKSVAGNAIRTRGIVAGDNIVIDDNESDLIIHATFDGDAETLSGFGHEVFVKRSQLNSLIDPEFIMEQAEVYTKQIAHDVFMESNASNIPDKDNTYDLGANGRRYADVFAVTFHGTATEAVRAKTLNRNGANEGDLLMWSDNRWKPSKVSISSINDIEGIDIDTPSTNDVLVYNASSGRWENTSLDDLNIRVDIPNNRYEDASELGETLIHDHSGRLLTLKTLSGDDGIIVDSMGGNIKLSLDSSIFDQLDQNTDEITEGNTNLYFTPERTIGAIRDQLVVGDLPFWSGVADGVVHYENGNLVTRDIVIPEVVLNVTELDDVNAAGLQVGQHLAWNGSKFTPASMPVNTDLLSDVNTYNNKDKFLTWDGTQYILSEIDTGMTLDDIDKSIAADGYVVTYNGSTFVLRAIGEGGSPVASDMLSEVNTVGAQNGYVLTWNGSGYELRDNQPSMSLDDLSDVNIINPTNGQVLTYRDGVTVFEELDIPVVSSINDLDEFSTLSDGQYLIFKDGVITSSDIEFPTPISTLAGLDDVNVSIMEEGKFLGVVDGNFSLVDGISDLTDLPSFAVDLSTENEMLVVEAGKVTSKPLPSDNITVEDAQTIRDLLAMGNGNVELVDGKLVSVTPTEPVVSLSDLDDVVIASPSNGEVLTYIDGGFVMSPIPEQELSVTISDIQDIDLSTMEDGSVLTWVDGTYKFTTADSTPTVTELSDLSDVNITTKEDGKVIGVVNGEFVLVDAAEPANTNLYSMADVNIDVLEPNHFLMWDGSAFVLSEVSSTAPSAQALGDLTDVDTTGINTGQVLTYDGTGFVFTTPSTGGEGVTSFTDLDDIDTTSVTTGQVLTFNGTGFAFTTPEQSSDGVTEFTALSDVDVTLSNDGQYLQIVDGKIVSTTLDNTTPITSINELSDVDITAFNDGEVLTIEGGKVVAKPQTPVDTSVGALSDLSDVNVTGIADGQILVWNGTSFVPSTLPTGGGATKVSDLSDVADDVPNDGDVLTYDGDTASYKPLPMPLQNGVNNGARYEIMRFDHNPDNTLNFVTPYTDNVELEDVVDGDRNMVRLRFKGYMLPPLSIFMYGYNRTNNTYVMSPVTVNQEALRIEGLGELGAPLLFEQREQTGDYLLTISSRHTENNAVRGDGFPPPPTHSFLVFLMGV